MMLCLLFPANLIRLYYLAIEEVMLALCTFNSVVLITGSHHVLVAKDRLTFHRDLSAPL